MTFLSHFAETAASNGDVFSALGIDWRLLILQIVAFLILVWLLAKFVYPWLMKSVDERQANIEAAAKAATEAQAAAADSQHETELLLETARKEAADIVATAKLEAADMQSKAEEKAKSAAEKIVADAHVQLSKDVEAAKRALHNETLELVALATEKVIGAAHTSKADQELIAKSVKESR